eukprot:356275-Chlamydomonas_euryale.AAC.11
MLRFTHPPCVRTLDSPTPVCTWSAHTPPAVCVLRGEVTRMLLNYGGLKFTEQNFGFDEWTNEWKAKMDEM